MIDLAKVPFHADGVTFLPDHAVAGLHHYVPAVPRLRTRPDGSPELLLLKYRLDPSLHDVLGGGLLSMTVDLGVDPELLDSLRAKVAAHAGTGPVTLAPLTVRGGTCELVLIDRSSADGPTDGPGGGPAGGNGEPIDSGLVARILDHAGPAWYGDKAATFQAVLSPEGVAVVEGAMRGGGLPVGVVYALEALALRPALRARITARWRDAYHFYENRFHGGQLLLAADIGPTVERLVHDEVISIEVDDLVPVDERSEVHQAALDQAQRYVLQELFTPTLGQAPPPGEPSQPGPLEVIGGVLKGIVGLVSFTYSLRQVDRDELKTFRYELRAAGAEPFVLAPQGTFAVLLEGGAVDVDRLITAVEPAASAEMRFDLAPLVDLAAEGIDHLEVVLRYGDDERRVVLDATEPRRTVTFWFEAEHGPSVHYRFEAHLLPTIGGLGGIVSSADEATDRRVLRLDPRTLYTDVAVRVVAEGVPFDRYPRVLVDLRGRDLASAWAWSDTVELGPERLEAAARLRAAAGARVRVERRIRYVDTSGVELVRDWDVIPAGVLVVGDPQPEVNDLLVLGSARWGTAVRRLVVELRSVSDPERVEARVLTAEEPAAVWAWRDADRRGYQYRVTVHTAQGEVHEGTWLPGTPGKLVVGERGRLREVELLLVGRSLADLGALAVKVRFEFRDDEAALFAEDEVLVTDLSAPIRWSYPVAHPDRQCFRYELAVVRADGTVDRRPAVDTDDLLAVAVLT